MYQDSVFLFSVISYVCIGYEFCLLTPVSGKTYGAMNNIILNSIVANHKINHIGQVKWAVSLVIVEY